MQWTDKSRSILKLVTSILFCEAVGLSSAFISNTDNMLWFATINKPSWNPPAYLFAPVWTTLYLLMGIALWLIWVKVEPDFKKQTAYVFFYAQLFFNFCWSIFFFKYHQLGLALIDILLMVVTISGTIYYFNKIDKRAAWLLIPYLAWVLFATFLNYTIWHIN